MKRFVKVLILIIIVIFSLVIYVDFSNDKYLSDELDIIKNKYKLNDIDYINKYKDSFIVRDNKNIYIYDLEYKEILKISLDKVHDNINNCDLVFKDNSVMYMSVTGNSKKVTISYYDLYTYELIDEVLVEE